MNTQQPLTLEAFAEEMRQQLCDIIGALAARDYQDAEQMTEALCQRAANVVHGVRMREEIETGPDLASLERYRNQPGIPE